MPSVHCFSGVIFRKSLPGHLVTPRPPPTHTFPLCLLPSLRYNAWAPHPAQPQGSGNNSLREGILPTFIERHRHMAVLWAPRVCAPLLTALQLLFSWLNTKAKKIQSDHPRMNLLRAELLSDRNFCAGKAAAASPVAL